MNTRIATVVVLATLCLGQQLQAQTKSMSVTVPFGFTAYNTDMPAGNYAVTRLTEKAVSLQLEGGLKSVLVTDAKETLSPQSIGKLVFNRFGSRYFLAEIWGHNADTGRIARKSSVENALARNVKHGQVSVRAGRD